ncbi:MAG: uroporphyrinogen-III synthase, partial [Proteobacteria bacterium]|nr:uroporphyrinogen-III synthase [Pseudomonadota bacterium]
GTIVFLMGVKNLPKITSQLINNGMPSNTPVALVRWGTTPRQFTITGTLETINERVKSIGLKPPAIIVVGNVIKLRKTMNWFENRPLMGKRIVVTRAREQASELIKLLSDLGAECLECPTIKVVPPDDWKPLDTAIENISSYDWLVFTSVNGVNFFFERLFAKGKDVRALGKLNTAVIGPATERRLFNFGLKSDIVPKNYIAESIIEAFKDEDVKGKKILLPRAKDARPILPVELTKMGVTVDEIISYYTKEDPDSANLLSKRLKEDTIDLITFTSSSTVKNFKALLPDNIFETKLKDINIACIGPITAETARDLGFNVNIVADSFTIPGLCEAILDYYRKEIP